MKEPQEQVALGLLISDQRILLVKQDYGGHFWTLPGGRVEAGESWVDAAVREVGEETGLEVAVCGVAALSQRKGMTCAVFLVEIRGGTLIESGAEVEATHWFSAEEIKAEQGSIEDYARMIAGAAFRDELHPLSYQIYPGRNGKADLFR